MVEIWNILKMAKRTTPEDDERRLAERIRNNYGKEIQDRNSFNLAFSKLLDTSDKALTDSQKSLRGKIFKRYSNLTEVQTELKAGEFTKKDLFTEAGGKDLAKDRQRTAKTIVKTKKKYIKNNGNDRQ